MDEIKKEDFVIKPCKSCSNPVTIDMDIFGRSTDVEISLGAIQKL